jgi:hypothetical protein
LKEVGMSDAKCAGPFRVANPEGISPETKIEAFVKRLNAGLNRFASGSIVAKPWGTTHHIYSGRQIVGGIKDDTLTVGPVVPPLAAEWMRETWRLVGGSCTSDWTVTQSPSAAPNIPPRVQRFLTALTDYDISFRDDYDNTVKAPFTVTCLRSQNVIIVLGNGVEFGEVRGDDFTPDTAMPYDIRAVLRHVWREVIREETLLNRIATLEAECAEKTRRLDQIAAAIKGDK